MRAATSGGYFSVLLGKLLVASKVLVESELRDDVAAYHAIKANRIRGGVSGTPLVKMRSGVVS